MERKLQRIILDLKDFAEERYLNYEAKETIERIVRELDRLHVYSTEV